MKYLIPFFLMVALGPIYSQNIWVKGYLGIYREPRLTLLQNLDPESILVTTRSTASGFLMPAIALETDDGNFWELGISWEGRNRSEIFSILRVPPSDSIQIVHIGSSKNKNIEGFIEYNHFFTKNAENRLQLFAGLVLNPYWSRFEFTSIVPYAYTSEAEILGVNLGVVPRIQYKLTNELLLDFNAALTFFSFQFEDSRIHNPVLTPRQQKNGLFELDYLSGYLMRVGLAWKIISKKSEAPTNSN